MANPFNETDIVRKTYFINESEKSATPAEDTGKVAQLESTGKFSPEFIDNKIEVVTFTASGTWIKDPYLKYIIVEVVGGGGAGGTGPVGSSDWRVSGGGGAGGYARKLIAASALGATETVTVGAASATSSFGAFITCGGGVAGLSAGSVSTISTGGAGGTATGGDVNIPGQPGDDGTDGGVATILTPGGKGGSTPLGYGGAPTQVNTNGQAGTGYGSGGSGGYGFNSTARSGGAGAPGIVIVTEYY